MLHIAKLLINMVKRQNTSSPIVKGVSILILLSCDTDNVIYRTMQNKKKVLGVSLQLLVGNVAAASLGFLVSLMMGVREDMFFTPNFV